MILIMGTPKKRYPKFWEIPKYEPVTTHELRRPSLPGQLTHLTQGSYGRLRPISPRSVEGMGSGQARNFGHLKVAYLHTHLRPQVYELRNQAFGILVSQALLPSPENMDPI